MSEALHKCQTFTLNSANAEASFTPLRIIALEVRRELGMKVLGSIWGDEKV